MNREQNNLFKRLNNRLPRFEKAADGTTKAIASPDGSLVVSKAGTMVPGRDGAQGEMGHVGQQGETGAAGKDGAPGRGGVDGTPGRDGADGMQGLPGRDGINGAPGAKGDKGDTGAPGPTGQDGAPGAKGDAGAAGKDGSPGVAGKDGLPGAKGDTGAAGPKGDTGATGATGAAGKDGTGALKAHAVRATTDAQGRYTWTFPAPFATGVLPVVQVSVQDTSTGSFNHKVTALTNASVSIQLTKTTPVNPLGAGVTVLGIDTNPVAVVHLTATAPG